MDQTCQCVQTKGGSDIATVDPASSAKTEPSSPQSLLHSFEQQFVEALHLLDPHFGRKHTTRNTFAEGQESSLGELVHDFQYKTTQLCNLQFSGTEYMEYTSQPYRAEIVERHPLL